MPLLTVAGQTLASDATMPRVGACCGWGPREATAAWSSRGDLGRRNESITIQRERGPSSWLPFTLERSKSPFQFNVSLEVLILESCLAFISLSHPSSLTIINKSDQ